jgi:hypothetical protein
MVEMRTLSELETLLSRLFSPDCSNEERIELNKILETFSCQKEVWRYCIYFLQNSMNDYTLMFSLHILENNVLYQWSLMEPNQKLEIRGFLMEYLIQMFSRISSFIRNKLIHVLVLIGQQDWPHDYPHFISDIIHVTILYLSLYHYLIISSSLFSSSFSLAQ